MKSLKTKKIVFLSSNRSELDLNLTIIKKLLKIRHLNSIFIITGAHLSKEYGRSKQTIDKNIKIDFKLKIDLSDSSKEAISSIIKKLLQEFIAILMKKKPDLVLIIGDRYEAFCLAAAANILDIKILHMHGGEKTEGSLDDIYRHVISKLSHFHCVSHNSYKKRLIQLGEQPKNIFNYGSIGSYNFQNLEKQKLDFFSDYKYFFKYRNKLVITYNSVSNNLKQSRKDLKSILSALKSFRHFGICFTLPNHDLDANYIRSEIKKFCKKNSNAFFVNHLGKEKFFFFLKNSDIFIGNSSSGIIEAPSAKIPTLNIGNRQLGRLMPPSVFNSKASTKILKNKIKFILKLKSKNKIKYKNIFYKKNILNNLVLLIKNILNNKIQVNKEFFDIRF